QKLSRQIANVPGIADVHLQQLTDRPELRLDVDRILASQLGLTEQDVSGSVLVSLSSTSQVSPNFWVNPTNRVNYRVAVQTPDYHIHSVDTLMNTPIVKGQTSSQPSAATPAPLTVVPGSPDRAKPSGPPAQLLGNLADLSRGSEAANINHYDVQPVYDVYANVQGRDLAAVSADVQKIV